MPFLMRNDDLSVDYLPIGSRGGPRSAVRPVMDQMRYRRALTSRRPTLVHINPSLDFRSFFRDGMFIYQAKRLGLPVLALYHGWEVPFERKVEQEFCWFFRRTYLKADAFMVLATHFSTALRRWGVKVPIYQTTTVVDDTLAGDFYFEGRQDALRNRTVTRLLFLARLEREKGVFELLEAVSVLAARGAPISLSIAGEGTVRKEAEAFIRQKDVLQGRVELLGYVSGARKREVLASHHVYCLPSYYAEGMPTSVLEAMAFGLPVLTAQVGGIKDFFEDGRMGYIVKPRQPTDIVRQLERLLTDDARLTAIANYNYIYAREHFLAPYVAERLAGIYRDTVDERGVAAPLPGP
jgi:glycosyltransferase involved in cell wall biosynthesis